MKLAHTCFLFLATVQPSAMVIADEPMSTVSIVNVIADPQRFEGKRVRLAGYARVAFEQSELCLFSEPPSRKECLWVEIDAGPYVDDKDRVRFDEANAKWKRWNERAVVIEAVFSASDSRYRQYSGVLRDVVLPTGPAQR